MLPTTRLSAAVSLSPSTTLKLRTLRDPAPSAVPDLKTFRPLFGSPSPARTSQETDSTSLPIDVSTTMPTEWLAGIASTTEAVFVMEMTLLSSETAPRPPLRMVILKRFSP